MAETENTEEHENVEATDYGDPGYENDLITADVALDLNLLATTAYLTYGLFDNVDIGVSVPYLFTTMRGSAVMQVLPIGSGASSPHYFAGTADNPVLRVGTNIEGEVRGKGGYVAVKGADGRPRAAVFARVGRAF